MNKVYGYARISRKTQNIERQIRNLINYDSKIVIYKEAYTGTKTLGRKEFIKLLSKVQKGDTIVFDSVSRMSRNAEEGIEIYFELYNKGVNLVFLKERHIDTDSYAKALEAAGINMASDGSAEGDLVSDISKAITKFMKAKASADIQKAFDQAEKEVTDLQERTKEGLETARLNGKQLGRKEGSTVITKKSKIMKDKICKMSGSFDGNMSDKEVMDTLKIARNTYYKYKRELKEDSFQRV